MICYNKIVGEDCSLKNTLNAELPKATEEILIVANDGKFRFVSNNVANRKA